MTLNANQQTLDRSFNELVEMRHVLSADSVFFAAVCSYIFTNFPS